MSVEHVHGGNFWMFACTAGGVDDGERCIGPECGEWVDWVDGYGWSAGCLWAVLTKQDTSENEDDGR